MPASGQHFDGEFKPHSRHKHLILEHYIRGWTRKLLLRRNAGDRVRLIDACAGPGHDGAGNPGSPVIAARVAAEARSQLAAEFKRDVQIEVTAIEKMASYFRELSRYLQPFGPSVGALRGTLEQHLPAILREGQGVPTFYFIDPFGLEPLQASVVCQALTQPETEAFMLFSDQSALRHFGVVQTVITAAVERLRSHDKALSLFPDLDREHRVRLELQARESQEALDITRERALEILDAAFGGRHWLLQIDSTPIERRRSRFLELYRDVLLDADMRYILAVPMLDADGVHTYFLVHATRNATGHELMKQSVEYALRNSPLPTEVVDAVWERLRIDLTTVVSYLRERFAGQTVAWSKDKEDRRALSLREIVLAETAMYPFQADELRTLLRPYRRPSSRALVCDFPI
jgi:three-Cys-motif partner protein